MAFALLTGCATLPPGIVDLPGAEGQGTAGPGTGSPDASSSPEPPASTPRSPILLAYGRFGSDATSGSVRLVLKPDGSHVIALNDFSTTPVGELSVVVTDTAGPESTPADGVHTVSLGVLKAASGDQSYDLPASLNVDSIKRVLIWNASTASARAAATLLKRG